MYGAIARSSAGTKNGDAGGIGRRPDRRRALRVVALLRALILACVFGATAPALAGDRAPHAGFPQALDLAGDGRDARATGRVIVVLFSAADCPWCHRVREEFLKPMLANAGDRRRMIVREIDIDARTPLVNFAGTTTTHERFAAAHRVSFVPTLAFLGPDGTPVAETLVGFRTADYYGYYVSTRIDAGLAKLAGAAR